MVRSDFIAVNRSMCADASLSQQLYTLQLFVRIKWVAMQKARVG